MLVTVLALPLRGVIDLANTVMLFLFTVFLCAVWLGRGPAVLSAFLGVALFDVFFVPPHLSFTVVDAQYLITFAVMLVVGLMTTHLVAQLAERREEAQQREQETRSLYELARDLGGALTYSQVGEIVCRFFDAKGFRTALLIDRAPIESDHEVIGDQALGQEAAAAADLAYAQAAEFRASFGILVPIRGSTRMRGLLAVAAGIDDGQETICAAVGTLAAIAIERIHYADVAGRSELTAQTEKLRSSILSAISHDLRTPLTSLVGVADTLGQSSSLPPSERSRIGVIRTQAHAMHRMVSNLLELVRLQSGNVAINRQWQPIEDVIGSSIRALGDVLVDRQVSIDAAADLPLVLIDAVLMERVLCNLLENAAKYSAAGSTVSLSAQVDGHWLVIGVRNVGAGFDAARLEHLFEPFVRGAHEPTVAGTGIGLSVCRTVVEAHGGTITAANVAGGAVVECRLPLGTPPVTDGATG